MTGALIRIALGATVAGWLPLAAMAQGVTSGRLDPYRAMDKSEQAIGRQLGQYTLIDQNGAPLSFASYRGQPLIVSLVYTACASVCPVTTQRLIDAVDEARNVIGGDRFAVLTVGFDARNDTPARMRQFASQQGISEENWKVASADAATILALLHDLGFSYASIAGGFDHITQTTVIDREGKVYRHVYGEDFPIRMFMEPLKDVVYGTSTSFSLSGLVDRIKFICTTYDPGKGRYRIDYGLAFGSVIAALSLVLFGGLLFREWRKTTRADAARRAAIRS